MYIYRAADADEGPARVPLQEINVRENGGDVQVLSVERKAAPRTPVFDPQNLDACGKASRIVQAKTKFAKKASPPPPLPPPPPESAGRVVVYCTSLRGIRQTYNDCQSTRKILDGYDVRVDKRDLWMHAGFKSELRAALGGGTAPRLPQVFVDGRLLGGADEISRLDEADELEAALDGCGGRAQGACGVCGGLIFVVCGECSGSCKVIVEDGDGKFISWCRCPECNENGLVRCPAC